MNITTAYPRYEAGAPIKPQPHKVGCSLPLFWSFGS